MLASSFFFELVLNKIYIFITKWKSSVNIFSHVVDKYFMQRLLLPPSHYIMNQLKTKYNSFDLSFPCVCVCVFLFALYLALSLSRAVVFSLFIRSLTRIHFIALPHIHTAGPFAWSTRTFTKTIYAVCFEHLNNTCIHTFINIMCTNEALPCVKWAQRHMCVRSYSYPFRS